VTTGSTTAGASPGGGANPDSNKPAGVGDGGGNSAGGAGYMRFVFVS
jgi:hypothetical protein